MIDTCAPVSKNTMMSLPSIVDKALTIEFTPDVRALTSLTPSILLILIGHWYFKCSVEPHL